MDGSFEESVVSPLLITFEDNFTTIYCDWNDGKSLTKLLASKLGRILRIQQASY